MRKPSGGISQKGCGSDRKWGLTVRIPMPALLTSRSMRPEAAGDAGDQRAGAAQLGHAFRSLVASRGRRSRRVYRPATPRSEGVTIGSRGCVRQAEMAARTLGRIAGFWSNVPMRMSARDDCSHNRVVIELASAW